MKLELTRARVCALLVATSLLAMLLGCGGGGGSNAGPAPAPAPPVSPPTSSSTPSAASDEASWINLLHTSLAFDTTRSKVYAYVPVTDSAHPGSFAIVDPATRAVTFTQPVDWVPYRFVVSADGQYLYAVPYGTKQVVRLRLPDFAEDMRVDLAAYVNPNAGNEAAATQGAGIAVSPSDSRVFAVALVDPAYELTCADRVRLYRDDVPLAEYVSTVDATAGNELKFEESGATLMTQCTGTIPEVATRLVYSSGKLLVGESVRGVYGVSTRFDMAGDLLLTSSGSLFRRQSLDLIGGLPPVTYTSYENYTTLLVEGCTFDSTDGSSIACLAQEGQGRRGVVFYDSSTASMTEGVQLDAPLGPFSQIIRTGPGQLVVGMGPDESRLVWINYPLGILPNSRIYFVSE